MRLISRLDGTEINVGDKVPDFRGDIATVLHIYPPSTVTGGQGGRVHLRYEAIGFDSLYFPGVIHARFDELLPDAEPLDFGRTHDRNMMREKGYDE